MNNLSYCRRKSGALSLALAGTLLFVPGLTSGSAAQGNRPELVFEQGHATRPQRFSFTLDATVLVSGEGDGTLKFWNTASGELLQTLQAGTGLLCLEFSPDGLKVATGGYTGVEVWDWRHQKRTSTFKTSYSRVVDVAWSPDGRWLAGCDGRAVLWDVASGAVIRTLGQRDEYGIHQLRFSPDGKRVVTSGSSLFLWNVATGELERTLSWEGHEEAAFLPDGQTVMSVGNGNLWPWRLRDGKLLRLPDDAKTGRGTLILSGDGRTATGAWQAQASAVYDTSNLREVKPLEGVTVDWGYSFPRDDNAKLSWDGALAAIGPQDEYSSGEIWDLKPPKRRSKLPRGVSFLTNAALSSDGALLVLSLNNRLVAWELDRPLSLREVSTSPEFGGPLNFAPNSRILWRRSEMRPGRYDLHAVDLSREKPAGQPLALPPKFSVWAQLPDGKGYIIIDRDPSKFSLFTPGTSGMETFVHKPNERPGAFSPDKTHAALGAGRSVRLWNYRTGESHILPWEHPGGLVALAFSPDGQVLASRSHDGGEVTLWELATRQIKHQFPGAGPTHSPITFSSDSQYLAYQMGRETVVYRVADGVKMMAVNGNPGNDVQFSGSGKTLLAGSRGGTTTFWDVATGKLKATLQLLNTGQTDKAALPDWIFYTPENYYVASPGAAKVMKWKWDGQLLPEAQFAAEYKKPEIVLEALREK